MDEIFIAIMEQIAQEMPELSLIDEDYGQLEMGAEEDQYPVTFPCVLIGNTNSDWHDLRGTEKRIRTDRPAGHRLLRRYKLRIRHV